MKKLFKLLVVSLMTVSLVACSSTTDDATATDAADATEAAVTCPVRIGLVTDTGGVDDKSFNQSAWEGIVRYQEDSGLDSSCIDYLQSDSEADYIPNLQNFVDEGFDLVVACGYLFQEAIDTVSAQAPDTKFLFIDSVGANENENVMSAVYSAEQGSFLVGVAAGLQSIEDGSNTVGFIGGAVGPLIGAFQAGYEQGVLAANPDATIYVDYVNSYSDDSKAQQIAEKQYGAGVTVIYQAAGNAGNGVIKAAKENGSVWSIGVDKDQYEDGMVDGTSVILTSMVKRVDTSTYDASKAVAEGTFEDGVVTFDLSNEGVGAELSSGRNLSDETIAIIQDYSDKIMNGEITVSAEPTIEDGQTN